MISISSTWGFWRPSQFARVLLPFLLFTFLLEGCIGENMEDCVTYQGKLSIVKSDGVNVDLATVGLYQFSNNGFVRIIPLNNDSLIVVTSDKNASFTLIGWGNLQTDTLEVSPPAPGEPASTGRVSLRSTAGGLHLTAPDLFYGSFQTDGGVSRGTSTDDGGTEHVTALTRATEVQTFKLVIKRIVCELSVHVLHADEYAGASPGELSLIVRGTGAALDFLGQPTSDIGSCSPLLRAVAAGEWLSPVFRVFPSPPNSNLSLELYRNGTLFNVITMDDEGNPLQALPDKQIRVTVDYRYSRVHVGVNVVPWGTTDQDVQL